MKREVMDYLMDIKSECEYLLKRMRDITYEELIKND